MAIYLRNISFVHARTSRNNILRSFCTTSINNVKTIFNWEDQLNLESQLQDDEKAARNSFKNYCQDKLFPRILEFNRNEIVDRAIFEEVGALGILGCTLNGYMAVQV